MPVHSFSRRVKTWRKIIKETGLSYQEMESLLKTTLKNKILFVVNLLEARKKLLYNQKKNNKISRQSLKWEKDSTDIWRDGIPVKSSFIKHAIS